MSVGTAILGGAVISGVMGDRAAGKAADATRGAADASIAEQRRQFDLVRGDTAPYRDVGEAALYNLAGLTGVPGFEGGVRTLNRDEQAELDNLLKMSQGGAGAGSPDEIAQLQSQLAVQRNLANSLGGDAPAGFGDKIRGMEARLANAPQTQTLTAEQQQRLEYLQGIQSGAQNASPRTPTEILEATPGYQFRLSESEKALERMQSARGISLAPRAAKELGRYVSDYASGEYGNYLEQMFRLSGLGGNAVNTSANAGANAASGISAANQFAGAGAANAAMVGGQATNSAIQGGLSNYVTLQNYNKMLDRLSPTPQFYGVGGSPY